MDGETYGDSSLCPTEHRHTIGAMDGSKDYKSFLYSDPPYVQYSRIYYPFHEYVMINFIIFRVPVYDTTYLRSNKELKPFLPLGIEAASREPDSCRHHSNETSAYSLSNLDEI